MKRHFFILLLDFMVIFNSVAIIKAQEKPSSNNYQVEPLNLTPDNSNQSDSANYSISASNSASNIGANAMANTEAGSYYEQNEALSVSISPLRIDLGPFKSQQFLRANTDIDLYKNTLPLTVLLIQNGPIKTFDDQQIITPTHCNQGLNRCYLGKEALWDNVARGGFGYRIVNNKIGFKKNYFRPLPDRSRGENPVLIGNFAVSQTEKMTISYQLSLSSNQPAVSYSGVVNYIVLPRF